MAVLRDHSISPRMLLARLTGLPDTCALHASIRGEPRGWGTDRHAWVSIFDALQNNTWVTSAVASKRRPRKPKPAKRPGKKKQQTVMSVKQLLGRGEHGQSRR